MELKEKMYCYDKVNRKLGIGKILLLGTNNNIIIQYKDCRKQVSKGNIETSYDITDLIEVGDYVNGYLVCGRNLEDIFYYYNEFGNYVTIESKEEIKSIVTKEQFNLIKYEV